MLRALAIGLAILLTLPGCARRASSDQLDSESIAEFSVGKDGRLLIIPCTIAGRPIRMLVDTGAVTTALDESFRTLLGKPTGSEILETSAGDTEVFRYAAPDIKFGGVCVRCETPVICLQLDSIKAAGGESFSGILGMDILRQFVLRIDFDRGTLSVGQRLLDEANGLSTRHPLIFNSELGPQAVASCGSLERLFRVDTGSATTCLDRESFDKLSTTNELIAGAAYKVVTAGGIAQARTGLLRELQLGPYGHRDVVCDEDRFCSFGLRYLSRYQVTLDFPGATMYLRKGPGYLKLGPRGTSGLAVVRSDGRTIVADVKRGGPAERGGVQVGDEIVEINGEPITKFDQFEIGQSLTAAAGTRVRLAVLRKGLRLEASFATHDRLGADIVIR